jgi:hypothetical protein
MKSLIKEQVKPFAGAYPIALGAGANTVTGEKIDRLGYDEAQVTIKNGAGTGGGAYTAVYSACKITTSDDLSGWGSPVDLYTLASGEFPIVVSNAKYANINLRGAKRYIRFEGVLTVGGSGSPVIPTDVTIILGNKSVNPV